MNDEFDYHAPAVGCEFCCVWMIDCTSVYFVRYDEKAEPHWYRVMPSSAKESPVVNREADVMYERAAARWNRRVKEN